MRIALCQTNMYWTIEENLNSILNWIEKAVAENTNLVIFPECALSGYHRQLPKTIDKSQLENAFQKLLDCAVKHGVDLIVGSPYFDKSDSNKIYNSALYFNTKTGNYQVASKIGITKAEALFFTPGKERVVFRVQNKNIGIVFCREINDKKNLLEDYKNADLDLIIWPSYIKWDNDKVDEDGLVEELYDYIDLSNALEVPILNVNAANSLNDPLIIGLGASRLIQNGVLKFSLNENQEVLKTISF